MPLLKRDAPFDDPDWIFNLKYGFGHSLSSKMAAY